MSSIPHTLKVTLKNATAEKLVELLKKNKHHGSRRALPDKVLTAVSITIIDNAQMSQIRELVKYAKQIT